MFDEPVIEISTREVVTITPDTSIATAIGIMEKKKFHNLVVRANENDAIYLVNIQDLLLASNPDSHVDGFMFKPHSVQKDTPTIDEISNNLLGIVTGGDILRRIYKPKRRMTAGEVTGEKVTRMEQPVSLIMNAPVITADIGADLAEVADLLWQHDIRGVPIVKDGVPRGIITVLDIMRYLRTLKEGAMVEVEIQGALDEEYKELAERIIETEVRKIAKFSRGIHWIKIVIKKERDRGGIPYYKISAHVKTPDNLYVGQAEPKPIKRITAKTEDVVEEMKMRKRRWDFIEVLKDALLSVERQIEEDRGRRWRRNRGSCEV
ncbi:MAG: CBS domain-containing protein [Candidatus Methanospirareceae archaeon]